MTEGDYADTILEVANLNSVDLIVLGNHNKKWLEKIMVGSTYKKLLEETNIRLLIVPIIKK